MDEPAQQTGAACPILRSFADVNVSDIPPSWQFGERLKQRSRPDDDVAVKCVDLSSTMRRPGQTTAVAVWYEAEARFTYGMVDVVD